MSITWSQRVFPNCFLKLLYWFIMLSTNICVLLSFNFMIGFYHFFSSMTTNSTLLVFFVCTSSLWKKLFPCTFISCFILCMKCLTMFLTCWSIRVLLLHLLICTSLWMILWLALKGSAMRYVGWWLNAHRYI